VKKGTGLQKLEQRIKTTRIKNERRIPAMKRFAIYVLALTIMLSLTAGMADAKGFKGPQAKNIIFMVPDGMGLSNVTSTVNESSGHGEPEIRPAAGAGLRVNADHVSAPVSKDGCGLPVDRGVDDFPFCAAFHVERLLVACRSAS
jgi:alkaline phosphatase